MLDMKLYAACGTADLPQDEETHEKPVSQSVLDWETGFVFFRQRWTAAAPVQGSVAGQGEVQQGVGPPLLVGGGAVVDLIAPAEVEVQGRWFCSLTVIWAM